MNLVFIVFVVLAAKEISLVRLLVLYLRFICLDGLHFLEHLGVALGHSDADEHVDEGSLRVVSRGVLAMFDLLLKVDNLLSLGLVDVTLCYLNTLPSA